MCNQSVTIEAQDRSSVSPVCGSRGGRWLATAIVVVLGLAASGCAQSMSEFAQTSSAMPTTAAAYPSNGPVALTPPGASDEPATVGSVMQPAVMVEEATVPAPRSGVATRAPMAITPSAETADAEPAPAATTNGYPNLGAPPEQPKSKLLTPEEKAKVIADLEALAKKQSAGLGKSASDCSKETLDPAQRLADASGDGRMLGSTARPDRANGRYNERG